ncbi:MAG: RNA methyltransferase [Gemmiger sp.]|uniref:TrmH family RNA methyltransferase n=1 Tax=Gemmiger sp. TaxID=2049027 RepID=UPI002E763F45|nr:RNA methyltransferase [Gemmiger sp.]MEE0801254.1 RNA methyltransferase [Gemmiger sp.]
MEAITSRENAKIKYACRLREEEKLRAADGLFFAEGPKLCLELARGCELRTLYATAAALARTPALSRFADRTVEVAPHVAEKLAGTRSSQDVFGIFVQPVTDADALLGTARRVLALEGVQDPGNVGTLLRSAAAFGFDAVLLGPGCAAPFAPKTLRASMGAAGRLPFAAVRDLPAALTALRSRGVVCLAAALYHSEPLDTAPRAYPGGLCVVIGSEGRGLTDPTVAACDRAVRIPMTDLVESLNAGVAGSVLLWHFRGV